MRTLARVCEMLIAYQRDGLPHAGEECFEVLENWYNQFEVVKNQRHGVGDQLILTYVEIQYLSAYLSLSQTSPRLDCGDIRSQNKTDAVYLEIMTSCEAFADLNDLNNSSDVRFFGPKIRFGFGIELILAVFHVAIYCRNRTIRQSAIDWLCKTYRRDMIWDSFHATKIADWMVRQESADPGEVQKSSIDKPESGPPQLLRISFYRTVKDAEDRETLSRPSSFHRPTWALLRFKQGWQTGEQWLYLDGDIFKGSTAFDHSLVTSTQRPNDIAFCYHIDEPYVPSAAAMVLLTQRKVDMENQKNRFSDIESAST